MAESWNHWMIENIAIRDSIIMKMMDRSLPPPPQSQSRFPEVGRTSKYTLTILSTIKPVTTTFTVKEMLRHVRVNISSPN